MGLFSEKAPEFTLATSPGDDPEDLFKAEIFAHKVGADTEKVTLPAVMLDFLQRVMKSSIDSLHTGKKAQAGLLRLLSSMYVLSFLLGLVAFGLAIGKGFGANSAEEVAATAIFGGLSASIFLAFFILRPTTGVERANVSNTWMNLATNSYWTRMAMSLQKQSDLRTARERDRRLEDTTGDAIKQLQTLLRYSRQSEKDYLELAREEAARSKEEERSIEVTSPTSPAKLETDKGKGLTIKVETKPDGQGMKWSLEGDDDGSLVQSQPGEFQYTRGSAAKDKVSLKFELLADQSKAAELVVTGAS